MNKKRYFLILIKQTITMNRTINCPLHGHIDITPRMSMIIDTVEFKRLHGLRQLGVSYMVYPSANHTRFEHSLGVSHLGKILIESLQKNQPELNITDNLVELVQIAGLIHDIGHGPFSHLYDDYIRKEGQPEHEERGIDIFKRIITEYEMSISEPEQQIIINMIVPPEDKKSNFLYQIIANKQCSIDVDKIDYIQRDSYHLGMGLSEKYDRLLTMCRVVEFNGNQVLAWPDKLQDEIVLLFETRYRLHRRVYNHRTAKACEYLIIDLLKDKNIFWKRTLENSWYCAIDSIALIAENATQHNILKKLYTRNIPKMIGEYFIASSGHIKDMDVKMTELISELDSHNIKHRGIMKLRIGFISGNGKNPLKNVVYFKKNKIGFQKKHYDSFMVPKNCQEYIYRIYIEDFDENQHKIALSLWEQKFTE